MLIATFAFSFMALLVKTLDRIPTIQVAFGRSLFSLMVCLFLIRRKRVHAFGKNHKLLITRGLLGTGGLVCYFYALQHIPLASAITIQNLSPMITILFAGIFFGDTKATWTQWIFFICAFIGVFIVKGFDSRISPFDLSVSLFGVLCASFAYNSVRKLNKTDSPLIVVFYFSWISALVLAPISAFQWVWPNLNEWLLLILLGIIVQFSQMNLTKAYQLEKPSRVSYLDHLSILYGLVGGYFIFGEVIPTQAFLGIILIILSVIAATMIGKRPI
ncbi:MAG: DMT family transporter [Deltaproteobacteria bacterium]|nr:DMT family transporter [Deltaproteobacteria bacterium]